MPTATINSEVRKSRLWWAVMMLFARLRLWRLTEFAMNRVYKMRIGRRWIPINGLQINWGDGE